MSWRERMEDFVLGEEDSAVAALVAEVTNRQTTLLDVVVSLGPHLTSQDTHRRCRATSLLSRLVSGLSKESLGEKEVKDLVAFFCDRLKDHHSVTPHVLQGLSALAVAPSCPADDLEKIIRSIFSEIHLQTLAQADRRHFYSMLDYLLLNRLRDIETLGGDMVYGFIQAMDAEKDPRNLIIAFRCASQIAQHFPIGMFAEEFFEVVSCYFPVDFTPPPNDPRGIRKEDLVIGLRNVFASSSKFADFALPLLLEKLQSTVISSKVDSLHTLAACAEVYGPKALAEYTNSFWSCIKREVFTPVSEALEEASLAALTSITKTLTGADDSAALDPFLTEIFASLRKHLCEPELKLMHSSAKLLQSAGAGSEEAGNKVISLAIPVLQDQFAKHSQTIPKRNTLDALNIFIALTENVTPKGKSSVLQPHKDSLYTLYISVLTGNNSQLKPLAGQGLVAMVAVKDMLSKEDVETVVTHLTDIALNDIDIAMRKASVEAVAAISLVEDYDTMIRRWTTTRFAASLREKSMEVDPGNEGSVELDKTALLEGLVTLSTTSSLVQETIRIFMEHIGSFLKVESNDDTLQEVKTTCQCIQKVLDKHVSHPESIGMFQHHVLMKCWELSSQACADETSNTTSVLSSRHSILEMAKLCRTVASHLRKSDSVVECTCQTFLQGDLSCVKIKDTNFGTLTSSSQRQLRLMPLFSATTCSTMQPLSVHHCDTILNVLQDLDTRQMTSDSIQDVAKCTAAILNKMPEGDCLEKWTNILQNKISPGDRTSDVMGFAHLLVWMCKAMVLRGHKSQQFYIAELLGGLNDKILAGICAQGFETVLEETPDLLNRSTHANITLMHKQRFFLLTLPSLLDGFGSAASEMKQFYLKALSCHLKFVPIEAVLPELPTLLPLLIQSMSVEEVGLRVSTISTMVNLLEHSPQLLISHVDDVLPKLLTLATDKSSMELRVTSLQCLATLTSLPHHTIFPHQTSVIRALGASLDDHKRLVRREAVKARSCWFLLGTNAT